MVEGKQHREIISQEAARVLNFPKVMHPEIGNESVVVCYSQLLRYNIDHFHVWRVSANRWECKWVNDHWRAVARRAYFLNGKKR